MKVIFRLFFFVTLISCSMFEEKLEHQFIYGFENDKDVTKENIAKVKQVFAKRLSVLGDDFEISNVTEKDILVKIKSNKLFKDRVNSILINQGKLEFWECFLAQDVLSLIATYKDSLNKNPLQGLVTPSNYGYGAELFSSKNKNVDSVFKILNSKKVADLVSKEFSYLKFLKGNRDQNDNVSYFALKSNKNGKALVTGENVIEAYQNFDQFGNPVISIQMDKEGAAYWEDLTGRAYSNQTKIAIVLNDLVYSAPGVTSGPILGGRSQISGNFTLEQIEDLSVILSAGGNIPKLKLIQYSKRKNQ